jgi:hypothetical protein
MVSTAIEIGSYSIPKHRFGLLLRETQKLHDKYYLEETNSTDIAATLGYPQRNNPFYAKLNDFISFGLLEAGGRSSYRITELGEKAIQPDNVRQREACEELIRNIPLWDKLLNKYGTKIDKKTFSEHLAVIADAEPADVKKLAETIRRAYLEDVEHIKSIEIPAKLPESQVQNSATREGFTVSIPKEATGYIAFPDYHTTIEIKDEISFNLAKQLLDAIGKKLGLVENK